MELSISDAKAVLPELVRRAEAGETVILMQHGQPVAHIVAVHPKPDLAARKAALLTLMGKTMERPADGPDAARSQDHLYDAQGVPV